jgi:hypothetical protein
MIRFLSKTRAAALLWLTVALIGSTVALSTAGCLALAAAGALCAVSLPQEPRVRFASALAMVPVGIAGAPTWTFVLAGGLLATTLAQSAAAAVPAPLELIQRHLEWCRRRGESAHLLWVHAPNVGRETAKAALAAFRVTDNVALLHEDSGHEEIVAMIDHTSFDRAGLERRLRAEVGEGAGLGWAIFPEDGVTLEALFEHARTAAVMSYTQSSPPSTQLQASFRRWGNRPPAGAPARSPNQG